MTWKRTPQGYVITTATLTRAGPIEYYGHEIGMTGAEANKKITVIRAKEELSKPETLASFNGLPFTITHPNDSKVDAKDHKEKAVGHLANARMGGEEVICDVYLTDEAAITTLEKTGIREVSVGYEPAEIVERGGKLYHINIRGNHVAAVAEGRYGVACRLNDKRGTTMFKTLKDVVSFLNGKKAKLKDADGAPALTEEELIGMIAALEASLAEFEGEGSEEAAAKVAEVTAQLAELKAQLEAMKSTPPTDSDPDDDAGKDGQIAALTKENEELKAENEKLKEELEALKAEKDAESTLNDAKARFPKVSFTDAKSARDVRIAALVSTKAFTDAQAKALNDDELRAAYAAVCATAKPKSNLGEMLLKDSKSTPKKSAAQRFGGK